MNVFVDIGINLLQIIAKMYEEQVADTGYGSGIGGSILEVSQGIAGVAGVCYIGGKLASQVMRNEGIDFIPLLRPFALIMLIGFIPEIADLIDTSFEKVSTVANADTISISERAAELIKKKQAYIDQKWKRLANDEELYKATFGTEGSHEILGVDIVKSFNLNFGRYKDEFKAALYDFVQEILSLLGDVAYIILFLISVVYRIILRVIAPLAIAMAIFDGFNTNYLEWFGKYINYALLPTVAGIYQNIAVKINLAFLDASMTSNQFDSGMGQDPFALGLAYTGVLIVILILYTQIPSITNMILVVGGTSGMVQGLTAKAVGGVQSARAGGALAGRTIVRGAGAVGSVAGTATKLAGNVLSAGYTGSTMAAYGTYRAGAAGVRAGSRLYGRIRNRFSKRDATQ